MSRIHEALRRAQQERASNSHMGGEVISGESMPWLGVGPARSTAGGPATGVGEFGEGTGVLTLERLQARCPKSTWSPDPRSAFFVDAKDHSPGTEQFRSLRSRLYQIRDKQPLQKLLVGSAVAGEGKTFVAVSLARAIVQQRGRSVLLIDSDLRISRMHVVLGAPAAPGLSDYLLGETDIFSVLQRGEQDGLFFIAGGKKAPNPAELIGSGRLRGLIQRLAPVFDWIILDSPPVVPVTDATLLAEMSDGVLMVVKAGGTPYDIAQKGCQQFRDKHLLGAVLNRISTATYGAYYYYSSDGKDS
jgi:protein-tyrosine kinase